MNSMSDPQNRNEKGNLPSVAVVILNWNGKAFLEKFLPSVLASSYQNKRIIVADNASADDSLPFLRNNFPAVEIIINETNDGFAKGYNDALKKVNADYFVLLNSDVEVTPGWIEPVIALMENDKTIAACQPKLIDQKDRKSFEYAGACGGWRDALGYPFARGRVLEKLEEDKGQYDDAVECAWATGAAMFVKAAVFNEMGGFDEYFFAHQEEIDLCWRMQHAGYKIFVQPASLVYHVGGGTLPKGNSKKTYLNFRNNLIVIYKNSSPAKRFLLIPFRMALDGMAAWRGLIRGDGGYFIVVLNAQLHFLHWLFFKKRGNAFPETIRKKLPGMYRGSLLWQYYIRRKKTFSEIVSGK